MPLPDALTDGPLALDAESDGTFTCPRHDDADPQTAPGVCELCAEEIAAAEAWAGMTNKERREAMGGAYGGDRAED